jgi:hypothetical protein
MFNPPQMLPRNRHGRRALEAGHDPFDPKPNYAADVLRTVKAIAEYRGESERRTHYLLQKGLIPGAYQIGSRWELSKSAHDRRIAERETV